MPSRKAGTRQFGATWWGQAWIEALEQRARLDPNRLPRGRTYARHDRVGPLTAETGEVRTSVRGSRAAAYRVRVRVRAFTDAEWAVALDAIAAPANHAAALLDGELDPAVVDDLAGAGIDLLPVAGEVDTSCSCPDWANPCKHAAAACYLVADLLDDDPFTLLLLRGKHRDDVLAGLRARRANPTNPPPGTGRALGRVDSGEAARDVFSDASARPPLPAPPLPSAHPGRPGPVTVGPPANSGVTTDELAALAADAAARAWQLAAGAGDGDLGLDFRTDLARRAAGDLGRPGFPVLAARARMPANDVARLGIAWQHGGIGALDVQDDRWEPPTDVMAEARHLLAPLGRVRIEANRVSLSTGRQVRYGRDG
ncbi:MAG: SWIM zinc finger family protein [Acidimicrobiia bacterium]